MTVRLSSWARLRWSTWLPSRSRRRWIALVLLVSVSGGLLVVRGQHAEDRRQAIRRARAFVHDHYDALKGGADFLSSAGPLSWLPPGTPLPAGRPMVRTSTATGARSLGPLGGPCDYLLAEHDRIVAEHQFTRVVAISPDQAMATGMLRRWSDVEVYLRACIAQDEPAMGMAADALADDLPAFNAARSVYMSYLGRA